MSVKSGELFAAQRVPRFPSELLRRAWRFARRKPLGALSAIIIVIFVLAAVFAPQLSPNDPNRIVPGSRLAPPGTVAADGNVLILGGDQAGRDLFARTLFGARYALGIGIAAVAIGISLGTVLGLLSGLAGGATDLVIQRLVEIKMAIPSLLFVIIIVAAIGPSIQTMMIAIGIASIPSVNRVVRGSTLAVKNMPYVEAARSVGAHPFRIARLAILPNIMAPIIIIATAALGGAILAEASLSFLGIGVPSPDASWGSMISGPGREFLLEHPILLIVPGWR